MIEFEFEVVDHGAWALGHVTVRGPDGVVSSKGRTPDQSMMIFLSVAGLLDAIRFLRRDSNRRAAAFHAIDCSFEILFERRRTRREGERVIVGNRGEVGSVTFDELDEALRAAAGPLFREHWQTICEDDALRQTVERSAREFGIETRPQHDRASGRRGRPSAGRTEMSSTDRHARVPEIALSQGLEVPPADWRGIDAVLPILERMREEGSVVLMKLDGERGPGGKLPYTMVVSGGRLGEQVVRLDAGSLEEGLAYIIDEYASRCWT